MESVISREQVLNIIKEIEKNGGFKSFSAYSDCWNAICKLPDLEVRAITYGRWFNNGNSIYCSNCGTYINDLQYDFFKNNFCPYCGASMYKHRKVKR